MILIVVLTFLFPLALYCLLLATINRRPHPVIVPGGWDFAGVLFGVSGFLVVGGPFILAGFNTTWREKYMRLRPGKWVEAISDVNPYWQAVWIAYFLVVVCWAAIMLWQRRHCTSIYNVEPSVLEMILGRVLDRLDIRWLRTGHGYVLSPGPVQLPALRVVKEDSFSAEPLPANSAAPADLIGQETILDLDVFATLYHVTLRWPDDAGPVRAAVEAELAREFTQVWTENNPTSLWLFSATAGMFFLIVFDLLLLLMLLYREVWS